MHIPALLTTLLLALPAALAGCGDPLPSLPKPGGDSDLRYLQSDGRTRTYQLFLPPGYTNKKAAPLIFSFHGNGGNATNQERVSGFSDSSVNKDYIVVYGNGVKDVNGSRSWQGASYSVPGVDDVQYTKDVLAAVQDELCIDSDKLYANGKSNGGGFVGLLSCDAKMSTTFAAFAPVSGAFYTATHTPCSPQGPTPVMEFHGMADTTIPYIGGTGKGGELIAVDAWIEEKARLNGCKEGAAPDTKEVLEDGNVWRRAWKCGGSKEVVVHYNETVLGHKWPGTEQTEPEDELVYATGPILEFFGNN